MYNKMAYILIAAANDFKHIHTHSSGLNFFTLHEIAGDYYNECSEQADYLTELALEFGEVMENPSYAAELVNWKAVNMSEYNLIDGVETMRSIMDKLYSAMDILDKEKSITPDAKNKVEEFMRYWAKENNYKLERLLNV